MGGIVEVPGVGNLSFHDRETAQPLTAADADERKRPTYDTDAQKFVLYSKQFDYHLRTGATAAQDSNSTAARRVQEWEQPEVRFSRAPSYGQDNWPQSTTPASSNDSSRPPTDEW